MRRRSAFIHASPAAIVPRAQFYAATAPELEITNLLDEGVLRHERRKVPVLTSLDTSLAALRQALQETR